MWKHPCSGMERSVVGFRVPCIWLGMVSLCHMIVLALILRSITAGFHSVCISLHSHQQWARILLSSHSCSHLVLYASLVVAILIEMRCNLKIDWICIFLITRNAGHFTEYLLDICDSVLRTVHFITQFIDWLGMFKTKLYYINSLFMYVGTEANSWMTLLFTMLTLGICVIRLGSR